jgi:prephenate dehydrogenase (NADP+)
MSTNGIVTPVAEVAQQGIAVGIIGMGDMGKMYARRIAAAGWRCVPRVYFRGLWNLTNSVSRVNACDRPDKYESLKAEFAGR